MHLKYAQLQMTYALVQVTQKVTKILEQDTTYDHEKF